MTTNPNLNYDNAIDLEILQKNYSNLLLQYKSSIAEYISYLNKQGNKPDLVSMRGRAYVGSNLSQKKNVSSLQDCKAMCSQNSKCSGATFISSSNKCNLVTGDGSIVSSSNNSYAIIEKSRQMLMNIESINQQLIAANNKILNKIQTSEPQILHNNANAAINTQELIDNYKSLTEEREQIFETLRQYETLDSVKNENDIKVTKNYYSFILLAILVAIIIFTLVKLTYKTNSPNVQFGGGKLGLESYYFIIGLILLIILINLGSKLFN